MADELPNEFDLIVIGTGFPESCVAAAASRVGKTVLHIDSNEFYGGAWASFGLDAFTALLENSSSGGGNGELRNCSWQWHLPEATTTVGEEETKKTENNGAATVWTRALLQQQSRRFNVDLCPKILYSAGELVQLLVSSNICRYAEFRAVDHVCTRHGDTLLTVPCSRSDVFNTKDLNIVEKRLLMKFLTVCMSYGEAKCEEDADEFRGRTFREYLRAQKVTDKITTCVMQAIAMCTDETSYEEGMARMQRFLDSLGRYGNTPFLFPMYGCGEIPQCFCRLCAVFGGVYCLKRRITEITIDADTSCAQVVVEGSTIKTRHVVCSPANVPENLQRGDVSISGLGALTNGLSRGVFIAASPLGREELNVGGGGVNLLRLVDGDKEAILLQLSHYSGTCPKGIFIFHLTTPALSDNPVTDLQPFTAQVFASTEGTTLTPPQILLSAYFTINARAPNSNAVDAATPIFCTAAPYYELDYDRSIRNAREIFTKLYGGDVEFLPRAPDPEEIVIEGEDPRALSESNLPDDLRAQLRELEAATGHMDIEDEENETTTSSVMAANSEQQQQQMDAE